MAQVVSIQIIYFSNLLLNVLYKDFVVVEGVELLPFIVTRQIKHDRKRSGRERGWNRQMSLSQDSNSGDL